MKRRPGLMRPMAETMRGDVLSRSQSGRMIPTTHSRRLKRLRKQSRRGGAAFRRGAKG